MARVRGRGRRPCLLHDRAEHRRTFVARHHRLRRHLFHLRCDLLSLANVPPAQRPEHYGIDRILRAGHHQQVLGAHPWPHRRPSAGLCDSSSPDAEALDGVGDSCLARLDQLDRRLGGLRIPVHAERVGHVAVPFPGQSDGAPTRAGSRRHRELDRQPPPPAEYLHTGLSAQPGKGASARSFSCRQLQHRRLVVLLSCRVPHQDTDRAHHSSPRRNGCVRQTLAALGSGRDGVCRVADRAVSGIGHDGTNQHRPAAYSANLSARPARRGRRRERASRREGATGVGLCSGC